MKVRDRLKRRAYSRHALLRTWDVEVRRDIRRQIREFESRQVVDAREFRGRCEKMDALLRKINGSRNFSFQAVCSAVNDAWVARLDAPRSEQKDR